jgi:hypothetical protein
MTAEDYDDKAQENDRPCLPGADFWICDWLMEGYEGSTYFSRNWVCGGVFSFFSFFFWIGRRKRKKIT